MAKCTYTYKNRQFDSEVALDDFLLNNGIDLTSKYGDLALSQADTLSILENVKKDASVLQEQYKRAREQAIYSDGEEALQFKPPYVGVIKFLSGLKNEKDKLLTPEFKEFNYWKERIKDWRQNKFEVDEKELFGETTTITDSLSDEDLREFIDEYNNTGESPQTDNQILQLISQVKEKWIVQGKTGTDIHAVIAFLFEQVKNGDNSGKLRLELNESFLIKTLENKFKYLDSNHIKDIIQYSRQLKKELNSKLGQNLLFFPEFQVSCKLSQEVEGKGDTLLGIIDLLVIDENGQAHIIDFKASPKNVFNSAKERSFWYQLGVYYRMLQQYGVLFSEYKTMIAPILMDGFKKENNTFIMNSVKARDSELLMDITSKATMYDIARNLDEFIPERKLVNLPPEEIGQKVEDFMNINFPEISTSKVYDDEGIKHLLQVRGGIKFDSKTNKYYIEETSGGTRYYTGDSESEVMDKFVKYYKEILPKKRQDYVNQTITAIKRGIQNETNEVDLPPVRGINREEGASDSWLRDLIGKYCNSNYELIVNDALQSYGCVLIQNKKSHQIDVIKITTDDLYYQQKFGNGNQLLTGNNIKDNVQSRKSNDMTMTAVTGNIHLMELMAILNCLPKLTEGGFIIGQLQVVNPHNLQGMVAGSNEELLYNFQELAKITNTKLEEVNGKKFELNLNKNQFASKVQLLRNRLTHILSKLDCDRFKKFKQFESTLTDLDSAITQYQEDKIILKLEELKKELEKHFSDKIQIQLENYNEDLNVARSLYEKTILALAEIKGFAFRQQFKDNADFLEKVNPITNGVQSLMMDNPGNLNNDTLNYLTKIVTEAYQNVREDVQREMVTIRDLVTNLKNDKGFNRAVEMTVGNQASLYMRMIKFENGDLLFENPWDNTNGLSDAEREFLKYTLIKINENRFRQSDDIESKRLSGDPSYYRVPLAIGDGASRQAVLGSLSEGLKYKLNRMNPKVWWEDAQKKLTGIFSDEINSNIGRDVFTMDNMFEMGEKDVERRLSEIQKQGREYFEHNLETLLIKHIFTYSSQKHINNIMPLAKASMIHLVVQGNLTNKKYTNATKYVTDYVKNKIKNESLTDSYFREAEAVIGKVKQAASFLILGFSPVQYVGQLIQGFLLDIRLCLQNIGIDDGTYTFENMRKAFTHVYADMFKIGSKPSKCSLINEFFGMNDMDMNTYSDKIKSDRYGLFNFTNLAFHCSSRPDFFNRMMLFVTQMIKDGTWEAYSVNEKNQLEYNWKKDKRFDAFANKDKSDPAKYQEQEGLYYAMAEQLVKEHAMNKDGSIFKIGDPLPKAYTNQQIESHKSLSDNIYGYYTHEKKAMIHTLTWGALWMQMRTFWSGKKNQYLGSAGVKLQGKYVHQKDSDGNLLYYKFEGNRRTITIDNTGVPVMKWEGQWQEGIFLTIASLIMDIKTGDVSFEDFMTDPKYAVARQNLIQFGYDITQFLIMGPIIAAMMGGWSDELGKEAKESDSILDGIWVTVAQIALKSVNYGFLDFNFIESIGAPIVDWKPISFSYMLRRITDLIDVMTGDKSFKSAALNFSTFTSLTKPIWATLEN